eukprot:8359689-Pyramimonas_sp.AAC.1
MSAQHAQWASCVERTISAHHGPPLPSTSRAADSKLQTGAVQQAMTFRGAPLRDKASYWWARALQ